MWRSLLKTEWTLRKNFWMLLLCALAWLAVTRAALASEYRGAVTFGGLPVPGAVVTASQGNKKVVAITDMRGVYAFGDLPDGRWTITIDMMCFETQKMDVVIAPGGPMAAFEMKLLTLAQIRSALKPGAGIITPVPQFKGVPAAGPETADDIKQQAAEGLLINGSVNNAATSKYTLAPQFGNRRNGGKSLYNGGAGFTFDNSALNAQPYALSGAPVSKVSYNRFTGVFTFGGPIKIPHVLRNGPNFFVAYSIARDHDASILPALVPDAAARTGDFTHVVDASGKPIVLTGYPTGIVPVSAQAASLLQYYPLPNLVGDARYNYQTPIVTDTQQDSLQTRLNKQIGRKDNVFGDFAFQKTKTTSPNLFAFIDTNQALGLTSSVNWSHRFSPRLGTTLGYKFSRLSTRSTPYWENRLNVSGVAGIHGNNQDAMNWGPPSISFSSGIYGLSDAQASFNRNRTEAISPSAQWSHRGHNLSFGIDFRRQEFNYLQQQNARGSFAFSGATTGSDLADFLIGIPYTSALSTGNADKYLRESVYDAYVSDDWRVSPQFTLNVGLRWEYGAPITELKNRLVNLDITPGFAAVTPVVAGTPLGPLTGQQLPNSLVKPDKTHVQPRVGLSWRPIPGSSLVVHAGYGIYADTSVYQSAALQLAQQAPFAKSLSVQNSAACPLTLANGFNACSTTTADLFAVDPNFRVGYAQTWNVSAQKDLPGSLQGTLSYLGIKGTRGNQEFFPNSYALGGVATGAPVGFAYLTSNGNSTREQGQAQLRRRLHNGLTASVQYTYSKSVDNDAALGGQGPVTPGATTTSASNVAYAQDWRNLRAERSRSTFDQRHLVNATLQYTTGMGIGGHSLMNGWRGAAYKEWTVQTTLSVGSGLPETPIYGLALPGTGHTGNLRPDVTGASLYQSSPGYFLNASAYTAPVAGRFGTAGRNSITGPSQFTMNASASRTFRLNHRFNLDARVDATNVLNHVTYTAYNTLLLFGQQTAAAGTPVTQTNSQFGAPSSTNGMRSLQTTVRVRF
jgi:hypothetical protein